MTFPSGGPGYPQQGGGQQPPGQQPPGPPSSGFPAQQQQQQQAPSGAAGLTQNLPLMLALGVAVLGLVQYFLGFSDTGDVGLGGVFLLGGGLLAAMTALPKVPKTLPFAALFSVLGALYVLDTLIGMQTSPGIVTVILILGILQMAAAVVALLVEQGIVKAPAPKPAAPSYGGQYGQPGQQQYGQPGQQYGQQQSGHGPGPGSQAGEPSAPFQPGQYGSPNPPSTTPPPGQQATTYAPQQGSFFQQQQQPPPSDNPGTPPGGFGKSN